MIPEGAYLDGFFTIQLKTDKTNEDLLSINSNPEMLQTVVHEYVHFLQDIFLLSDICVEQNTMTDACFEKPLSSRIREKPFCLLTQMYRQWGLYKHKTKKGDDYLEKISKFQ